MVNTIITGNANPVNPCYNIGSQGQPLTDYRNESYQTLLESGEWYEDYLVDLLRAKGLDAGRYRQDLSMLSKYDVRFSQYQRDCYIQLPGVRVNLETKARNNPFNYDDILVGKRRGWDNKRFKTHFLAITDQHSLEVRVTLADTNTRAKRWLQRSYNDDCYSVPKRYFMPLEKLVRLLKQGKLPRSHWQHQPSNSVKVVR